MMYPSSRRRPLNLFGLVAATAWIVLTGGTGSLEAASPGPNPPPGHQRVDFVTPHPPYPGEAWLTGIDGDVVVRVTWAADGSVREAVVVKSSGSDLLDAPTRKYIKAHWHSYTGKEETRTVTLRYVLRHYPKR